MTAASLCLPRHGACRGAEPLCVLFSSPFAKGGHRGIGLGVAWSWATAGFLLPQEWRSLSPMAQVAGAAADRGPDAAALLLIPNRNLNTPRRLTSSSYRSTITRKDVTAVMPYFNGIANPVCTTK